MRPNQIKIVTSTRYLWVLFLMVFAFPAMAQDNIDEQIASWLQPVEAQYVCMVNNQRYDAPQISVEVEGKTYFGCCQMCKAKLEKSEQMRSATDPMSGNAVDKADAIIGSDQQNHVYYFENLENFSRFTEADVPIEHEHE